MKKIMCIVFAIALTLLSIPVYATNETPSTAIRYGTSQSVVGIKAVYEVKTENVKSISVSFADGIGIAEQNYVNGKLKIAIASSVPIDLSKQIAWVTATLNDDTKVAPELVLTKLQFNGKTATENLTPGTATALLDGGLLSVSVSAHNDYLNNEYIVMVGAYTGEGQMVAVGCKTLAFDENNETLSFELPKCSNAENIKVFYLTKAYVPVFEAETIPVD